jgi:hypothetical protein
MLMVVFLPSPLSKVDYTQLREASTTPMSSVAVFPSEQCGSLCV